MSIRIERKPHVEVTDEESGWSMKGGRTFADRSTTNEMWHANGARCTVDLRPIERDDKPGAFVQVMGIPYLNPGEEKGLTMRKLPAPGDFIELAELYRIASQLLIAWHEATYTNVAPMRVFLPS